MLKHTEVDHRQLEKFEHDIRIKKQQLIKETEHFKTFI